MNKINILLADDHAMFRDGLKFIIKTNSDYTIIGEAGDGREALEKIDLLNPDLVILDISMPNTTGIEVARQVRKYHIGTKIIMLSRHNNDEYVKELMSYGVHGYILKDNTSDDLLKAISEVMKGNIFISPVMMNKIVDNYIHGTISRQSDHIFSIMTKREIEIIKHVAEGRTSAEISKILRVSHKTINVHRVNIMHKLNIHKATDLVKYAIKTGLVDN